MTNQELEGKLAEIKLWLDTNFPTKYTTTKGNTADRPAAPTRPTIFTDQETKKVYFWAVDEWIEAGGSDSKWTDTLLDALEDKVDANKVLHDNNHSDMVDKFDDCEPKGKYHFRQVTVHSPEGGTYYTNTGTKYGYIRIKIPSNAVNSMIMFWVDVYQYTTGESMSMLISAYTSTASWYNTGVTTICKHSTFDPKVQFTLQDRYNRYVYIGDSASDSWRYCSVKVRDFNCCYGDYTLSTWGKGWIVDISSDAIIGSVKLTNEGNSLLKGGADVVSKCATAGQNDNIYDESKNNTANLEWVGDHVRRQIKTYAGLRGGGMLSLYDSTDREIYQDEYITVISGGYNTLAIKNGTLGFDSMGFEFSCRVANGVWYKSQDITSTKAYPILAYIGNTSSGSISYAHSFSVGNTRPTQTWYRYGYYGDRDPLVIYMINGHSEIHYRITICDWIGSAFALVESLK